MIRFYPAFLFGAFCLLMTFSVFAADRVTEKRPSAESYRNAETGIDFPADLGTFRKKEVILNYNILVGTLIRYSDRNGACADIYIYALNAEPKQISDRAVAEHFLLCEKAVLNLPSAGGIVSEVVEKKSVRTGPVRSAEFLIVASEVPTDSVLAVFSCRDRIVKVRMSVSSELAESTDFKSFTNSLKELFHLR